MCFDDHTHSATIQTDKNYKIETETESESKSKSYPWFWLADLLQQRYV